MPTKIVIHEQSPDQVKFYTHDTVFVLTAKREELRELEKIEQVKSAGIFFLLGDDMLYVEKSKNICQSLSIMDSPDEDAYNAFWYRFIAIGSLLDPLSETETAYLKGIIVKILCQNGRIEEDNEVEEFKIDYFSKKKVENIFRIAEWIISEIIRENIFEHYNPENINLAESQEFQQTSPEDIFSKESPFLEHQFFVEIEDGERISGSNRTQNQINFFKYLLSNPKYRQKVLDFCKEGAPTQSNCVGSVQGFVAGKESTYRLEKNIYLLTHSSTEERIKSMKKFADFAGLEIKFHKW